MPDPVWAWLVGGGLTVVVTILGGIRWLAKVVSREEMKLVLEQHDADPYAHQAAARHNHAGMETKLDRLAEQMTEVHEDLARLIDAHNAAATTGACIVVRSRREMGERGGR